MAVTWTHIIGVKEFNVFYQDILHIWIILRNSLFFFKQSQLGHEVKKLNYVSTSLSVHECSLTLPLWEAIFVRSLRQVDRDGAMPSFFSFFFLNALSFDQILRSDNLSTPEIPYHPLYVLLYQSSLLPSPPSLKVSIWLAVGLTISFSKLTGQKSVETCLLTWHISLCTPFPSSPLCPPTLLSSLLNYNVSPAALSS